MNKKGITQNSLIKALFLYLMISSVIFYWQYETGSTVIPSATVNSVYNTFASANSTGVNPSWTNSSSPVVDTSSGTSGLITYLDPLKGVVSFIVIMLNLFMAVPGLLFSPAFPLAIKIFICLPISIFGLAALVLLFRGVPG